MSIWAVTSLVASFPCLSTKVVLTTISFLKLHNFPLFELQLGVNNFWLRLRRKLLKLGPIVSLKNEGLRRRPPQFDLVILIKDDMLHIGLQVIVAIKASWRKSKNRFVYTELNFLEAAFLPITTLTLAISCTWVPNQTKFGFTTNYNIQRFNSFIKNFFVMLLITFLDNASQFNEIFLTAMRNYINLVWLSSRQTLFSNLPK
jgi:hypothetical protein